jgi:hypothetical protein
MTNPHSFTEAMESLDRLVEQGRTQGAANVESTAEKARPVHSSPGIRALDGGPLEARARLEGQLLLDGMNRAGIGKWYSAGSLLGGNQ